MKANKNNIRKGFKPETISKLVAVLLSLISFFMDLLKKGSPLKIVVSNGNRKIGQCMNVSLAPIVSCGNCAKCKYHCYDVKACLQYENVRIARAKNTAIFNHNREDFFRQLWVKMSRKRTNKFLRFHVSGEIRDLNHFEYMIKTALLFPDFTIWTYTKMYRIVNEWIRLHGGSKNSLPKNFKVMYSEWKGVKVDNPYEMPVFRCAFNESDRVGFECPGNCDYCKEHKCGCIAGVDCWVNLH